MVFSEPSLRGAKRRSNPESFCDSGLLRFARNDVAQTRYIMLGGACLYWPILGRDRCSIGADDLGKRIAPGAEQGRGQIALDVFDQPEPLIHQRGIKLDQAGAG